MILSILRQRALDRGATVHSNLHSVGSSVSRWNIASFDFSAGGSWLAGNLRQRVQTACLSVLPFLHDLFMPRFRHELRGRLGPPVHFWSRFARRHSPTSPTKQEMSRQDDVSQNDPTSWMSTLR